MNKNKSRIMAFLCLLMIVSLIGNPSRAYAAKKQAEIVSLDEQQDLVAMFSFDKEVVDIAFISPSGNKLTSSDSNVEMESGELWSTYKILDAEAGTWSVEYDMKGNESIEYSIIEENLGLWIQYITVTPVDDDNVTVNFEADCDSAKIVYQYRIYAVSQKDTSIAKEIAYDWADANENVETTISLSKIPSDTYSLRLEVSCSTGDAEIFDSMMSDPFDYVNTNEPAGIENFKAKVDISNLECDVDWEEYSEGRFDQYRLVIHGDEEEAIYDGTLDGDVTSSGAIFPQGTSKLSISLSCHDYYDDMWSAPLTKEIDLENGEFIKMGTEEVTNSNQATIKYSALLERALQISLNGGEVEEYRLKDSGYVSLTLEQGNNKIYAEMECDNDIFFIIDAEVYFDAYPPKITLYEDLEGKTLYTDSIEILGCITGGTSLSINNKNIELNESNEFAITENLSLGENVFIIEASDINGNSSVSVVTIYRESKISSTLGGASNWEKLLPLMGALLTSVVIIILAYVFMRNKREKTKVKEKKKRGIIQLIILDIVIILLEIGSIYEFVVHYLYSNSTKYLGLAERSMKEAARYLTVQKIFGFISLIGAGVCAFMIFITVMRGKKKKSENVGNE